MSQQAIRLKIIAELQADQLGMDVKLVEDNTVEVNDEFHNESVKACPISKGINRHQISS